ncbi:MAG: mechanosensitive ion channel family protein [Caldilineaceae bacterium]
MIEEFDAYQNLNLLQFAVTAIGVLLIGVLLEVALRYGRAWAMNRQNTWVEAILNALTWQPLFWAIMLGVVWPALGLASIITGRQQDLDARNMLLMISVTIIVVRLINGLLRSLSARSPSTSVSLLHHILLGLGGLVITAIILGYLFDISSLLLFLAIVGGVTGLTVIFEDPIKNLVSGISLTFSKRLAPGDVIRLPSGIEGRVTDIQWDVTVVRQLANNFAIVPNSIMTEAEIVNYDRPDPVLSVPVAVGVSYDSDLAHVEQVTLEEARQAMHTINGDLSLPDPVIHYNAFADSSINFDVILRAGNYAGRNRLKHEFIKRLHRRYQTEHIEIPYPIRTLMASPDQPLTVAGRDHLEATLPVPGSSATPERA